MCLSIWFLQCCAGATFLLPSVAPLTFTPMFSEVQCWRHGSPNGGPSPSGCSESICRVLLLLAAVSQGEIQQHKPHIFCAYSISCCCDTDLMDYLAILISSFCSCPSQFLQTSRLQESIWFLCIYLSFLLYYLSYALVQEIVLFI